MMDVVEEDKSGVKLREDEEFNDDSLNHSSGGEGIECQFNTVGHFLWHSSK